MTKKHMIELNTTQSTAVDAYMIVSVDIIPGHRQGKRKVVCTDPYLTRITNYFKGRRNNFAFRTPKSAGWVRTKIVIRLSNGMNIKVGIDSLADAEEFHKNTISQIAAAMVS